LDKIKQNQLASLKISREVIATITRVAALEIPGVAALAEPKKNLKGIFSGGLSKSIEINLLDDFAEIDLCLDLEFGAKIPEVCWAVQANVKENVQTMTGIVVSKVNVTVLGIQIPSRNEGFDE
jgi:uncharacterized alkaline shock family protein YloU